MRTSRLKKQNLKIAVVILNWNGQKLLEQFLPSIIQYSKEATIYVADNASTDDSVSFVTAHFPSVKIMRKELPVVFLIPQGLVI